MLTSNSDGGYPVCNVYVMSENHSAIVINMKMLIA